MQTRGSQIYALTHHRLQTHIAMKVAFAIHAPEPSRGPHTQNGIRQVASKELSALVKVFPPSDLGHILRSASMSTSQALDAFHSKTLKPWFARPGFCQSGMEKTMPHSDHSQANTSSHATCRHPQRCDHHESVKSTGESSE